MTWLTFAILAQLAGSPEPLRVASVFTDHMVLQRDAIDPVFGFATPGDTVTVGIANQTQTAVADDRGRWQVKLAPLDPGGPLTMSVTGSAVGDAPISLRDVLVGEVWVASGQSNMEFREENADDYEQARREASPDVRMFTVSHSSSETPKTTVGGSWQVAGENGIGYFSAVAYAFACELHRTLNVPVGILNASWGGTPIESWTSRPGLSKDPVAREILNRYLSALERYPQDRADYEQALADWKADRVDRVNQGVIDGWAAVDADDSQWTSVELPDTIKSIETRDVQGAFWFRRTIDLPESMVGQTLNLDLGPIVTFDRAYVNGVQVGLTNSETPNAFVTSRKYTVPAALIHAGENTIAVRVFVDYGNGGFTGPPSSMRLAGIGEGAESVPLAGFWKYRVERIAMPDAPPPVPPVGPGSAYAPGGLFNGMIAPLIPYQFQGAIWYQGEANAPRAAQYRSLLPALIWDWRAAWGKPTFPFYLVQLPNYLERNPEPGDSAWAEIREAQAISTRVPNTGMATTIDLGDAKDIHPKNKREVGRRLALGVLHNVYHLADVAPSGPAFRGYKIDDGRIILTFQTYAQGLQTSDGAPPRGFAIAGSDRKFYWADAFVSGNKVIVSSPHVPAPVAVRYGWSDNPDVNLVNRGGLPAAPFRTDDWPGITDRTP